LASKLTLDLSVKSGQSPAKFEIWAEGGSIRSTGIDGVITTIYRGLYFYRVTKMGFKEINGTLNLIDEKGTVLKCVLYEVRTIDGPYPCTLDK
jgi:hypothetical protein